MRGIIKRISLGLASLAVVASMGTALVGAQATSGSGNGFRLSPVRSELTIEKGKSTVLTINIENPTDVQTTVQAVINDFISSDKENGEPRLILDDTGETPKNSFKELVQPLDDVVLGPREKKDIDVTIAVPADASAGGYYGAIRFVPASTTGSGNVGLTASVGSIVLVRVPGNLTERLELVQLSAAQNNNAKSFFMSGDVSALIRLKNTGDIHVQPFGKVQVKNMFGKVVGEYELNSTDPRANILPDSTRKFVDALPDNNFLGRYTIVANIGYSQGSGELISSTASFWYMPLWAIIVLIALIVLVVAGIYWMVRKRKARKQHKHDVNKQKK